MLAITATVDLILFLVFPHTAYHGCVALLLSKMYSNSLLVLLNSRIRIIGSRSERSTGEESYNSVHLDHLNSRRGGAFRLTARSAVDFGGVHVREETWIHADREAVAVEDQVSLVLRRFSCLETLI